MDFLKKHSGLIVKLLINQVGIAIFSVVLNLAVQTAGWGKQYLIFVSVFAILFYSYLLYVLLWEQGSQDIIRMETHRIPMDTRVGLKAAFYANVPNIVFFLCLLAGAIISTATSLESTGMFTVVNIIYCFLFASMYFGVSLNIGILTGTELGAEWIQVICYAVSLLIPILISHLGYRLGQKNIRFLIGKDHRIK